MGGVQYRHAQPDDASAVLTVKQRAIEGIDSSIYTASQLAAWRPGDGALSHFRRAIEDSSLEILLAEKANTVVGYGVLNTASGRIDAIFVRPAHTQSGIASSLVRQFESRARMDDITELKVVSSLNARSFYERLGYWDFGRKNRTIDGVELEFAIMRKRL